jgi:cellulase
LPPTTTSKPASTTTPTTVSPPPISTSPGGTAAEYAQCGGINYTGPTVCASPYTCTYSSAYYSQCLPA